MTDDRLSMAAADASRQAEVGRPWPLVDTHCHLDLPHFDGDREAVIERAVAAGVTRIVNPAIDLASCRRVLALAERYPAVYAAIGVHPNDCADFDDATLPTLQEMARHPKVVAIGEIGLDYYWRQVPPDQQKRALRAQLGLAAELGLPVILHTRNAQSGSRECTTDLLWELARWWPAIRKSQGSSVITGTTEDGFAGVWHAFSGDLAEAQEAYRLGLVLGLGGPVTYLNARRLRALVPQLRSDRLLVETDAPYLSPHPYRGQRNEPARVPLIAQTLAQLLGLTSQAVAAQTTTTAELCFRAMTENR